MRNSLFQITLFWWLGIAGAWAHESGRVGANTHSRVEQTPRGLRLTYRVEFRSEASAQEWHKLDQNGDGAIGDKEKAGYLNAESPWFARPLLVKNVELGVPNRFLIEGDSNRLTVELGWDVNSQASRWTVRWSGSEQLTGKHDMVLELPTTPLTTPEFSGANLVFARVAGEHRPWTQRWTWDNSAGELEQALSSKSLWAGLLTAFILGSLHGLVPSHGKSTLKAYLRGSRMTLAQAVLAGFLITGTRTCAVMLAGLACLWVLENHLPPASIPWVGVLSGLVITIVGVRLLLRPTVDVALEQEPVAGPVPDRVSTRELFWLGLRDGLLPRAEALAVLFSALALNRLVMGALVMLAFSAGLGATLLFLGGLLVSSPERFERRYPSSGSIARISDVSYVFLVLLGVVLAARSLWQTGAFRLL